MANEIKDIGNGSGFLYITKPNGTGIISTLPNNNEGVRAVLRDAMSSGLVPWEVFFNTDPNPPMNDNYDPSFGHRYYINVSGAIGSLTSATEITHYLVNKGLQSNLRIETATIAAGVITITRKGFITKVIVDTEGAAAADDLNTITQGEFMPGDILILVGADAARVVTLKTGGGNFTGADARDFSTGNRSRTIMLQFERADKSTTGVWYEVGRSNSPVKTTAEMRAAGKAVIDDGVESVTVNVAGITYTRTAGTSKRYLHMTGSGTLLGHVNVVGGASPVDGDTWYVQYDSMINISAFLVTIFGLVLTAEQANEGGFLVVATYDGPNATYRTTIILNQYNRGDCCIYRRTRITIPSADVLQLNGTPFQVIASPGAGKAIQVVDATAMMDYNSAAYTTNGGLQLITNNATLQQWNWGSNFLFGTGANRAFIGQREESTGLTDTQIVANEPLMATVGTGDPAAGDSDITLEIVYRLVTTL